MGPIGGTLNDMREWQSIGVPFSFGKEHPHGKNGFAEVSKNLASYKI